MKPNHTRVNSFALVVVTLLMASTLITRSALAAITIDLTVTTSSLITITVDGNPVVGRDLGIRYTISSTYEVTSIVAKVGSLSTSLPLTPNGVPINVSSLGRGVYTVTLEVTDAFGTKASASKQFFHDNPPALTIETPDPDRVERTSSLLVRAHCVDDNPAGCNYLRLTAPGALSSTIVVRGSDLEYSIPLDEMWQKGDRNATLFVEAVDSVNWNTTDSRRFYLDRSRHLDLNERALGTILDFDATRFLIDQRGRLAVQKRDTRELRYVTTTERFRNAQLTSRGAVWEEPDWEISGCLGAVRQLVDDQVSEVARRCNLGLRPVISNKVVTWTQGDPHRLMRFWLGSQQQVTGPEWPRQNVLRVGSNGDAYRFDQDGTSMRILREHGGVLTEIGVDTYSDYRFEIWANDGTLIYCINDCRAIDLATHSVESIQGLPELPGPIDSKLAGEWFAFTLRGSTPYSTHVWRWHSGADAKRMTFFNAPTTLQEAAPNGELVVELDASVPPDTGPPETGEPGQRGRYFIPTEGGEPQWFTSTLDGRIVARCDGWYLLFGGALLRSNLPSMQTTFECVPLSGAPDAGSDAGTIPPDGGSISDGGGVGPAADASSGDADSTASDAETSTPEAEPGHDSDAETAHVDGGATSDADGALTAMDGQGPAAADDDGASTTGDDERGLSTDGNDASVKPADSDDGDDDGCSVHTAVGFESKRATTWLLNVLAMALLRRRRAR